MSKTTTKNKTFKKPGKNKEYFKCTNKSFRNESQNHFPAYTYPLMSARFDTNPSCYRHWKLFICLPFTYWHSHLPPVSLNAAHYIPMKQHNTIQHNITTASRELPLQMSRSRDGVARWTRRSGSSTRSLHQKLWASSSDKRTWEMIYFLSITTVLTPLIVLRVGHYNIFIILFYLFDPYTFLVNFSSNMPVLYLRDIPVLFRTKFNRYLYGRYELA